MKRVFAIANQKGGVGKTTTVINLGAYLAGLGHNVLLVDCDPQANTSRSLTIPQVETTIYDVLVDGASANETITSTSLEKLDLLPANPDLAGAEVELIDSSRRESRLRDELRTLTSVYDYILLDCPPSLGLLTINALVAADSVIIPVQCEFLALEGVSRLMDTVGRVQASLNPQLKVFGLLMTMYDRRTSLSEQVAQEVRKHFPNLTFETVIPRNVRLSEAPSYGQSILQYDPTSSGAEAYRMLATEVVARG